MLTAAHKCPTSPSQPVIQMVSKNLRMKHHITMDSQKNNPCLAMSYLLENDPLAPACSNISGLVFFDLHRLC